MPTLTENKTFIDLAIAKSSGLNDLGVPIGEGTVVKKGRLHEFAQTLEDGKIGRRYQDVKLIAIKTIQAGATIAKLFIQFEVFGDDTVPEAAGPTFEGGVYAGTESLATVTPGNIFMPYASFWYPNRYVFDIPLDVFEKADRFEFVAKADQVATI